MTLTREELHVFVDSELSFCGCGDPGAALLSFRGLLRLHPLHANGNWKRLDGLIPDKGMKYLMLYWIDGLGLTEHGSLISGAWLTERGGEVLAAIDALGDDEAVAAFMAEAEDCCIHGVNYRQDECAACRDRAPFSEGTLGAEWFPDSQVKREGQDEREDG